MYVKTEPEKTTEQSMLTKWAGPSKIGKLSEPVAFAFMRLMRFANTRAVTEWILWEARKPPGLPTTLSESLE